MEKGEINLLNTLSLAKICCITSLGVLEYFQPLIYFFLSFFLQCYGGLHILPLCYDTSPR